LIVWFNFDHLVHTTSEAAVFIRMCRCLCASLCPERMSQLSFESCSVLIEGLEYSSVFLMLVMSVRALE